MVEVTTMLSILTVKGKDIHRFLCDIHNEEGWDLYGSEIIEVTFKQDMAVFKLTVKEGIADSIMEWIGNITGDYIELESTLLALYSDGFAVYKDGSPSMKHHYIKIQDMELACKLLKEHKDNIKKKPSTTPKLINALENECLPRPAKFPWWTPTTSATPSCTIPGKQLKLQQVGSNTFKDENYGFIFHILGDEYVCIAMERDGKRQKLDEEAIKICKEIGVQYHPDGFEF